MCNKRKRQWCRVLALHEINMKNDATLPLVVSANIQEKQTEQHSVERAGERKKAREKRRVLCSMRGCRRRHRRCKVINFMIPRIFLHAKVKWCTKNTTAQSYFWPSSGAWRPFNAPQHPHFRTEIIYCLNPCQIAYCS
jgi:hypothetical protein